MNNEPSSNGSGTMSDFLPPLDCSLNLGEIFDAHIGHENSGAAYSFADEAGNITDISYLEFARAAHRVAHLLRPQRRGPEGQVIAIVALTDVLIYQTIVAGCIKAGLVVCSHFINLSKVSPFPIAIPDFPPKLRPRHIPSAHQH
jgi:hypothetical protein